MIPKKPELPKELIYKMVVGKSGCAWFIPTNIPNPGDEIKVTNSKNWNIAGEGYGGSTLLLKLENDPIPFELRGGWHSNSNGLLSDTGVDLTQYHYTYCIISEDGDFWTKTVTGVYYQDSEWKVGEFSRPEKLAKIYANELGKPVYLSATSFGGGCYGYINPDK